MSEWYHHRYVCDKCRVISYDKITICRRCGSKSITKKVNSKQLASELKSGKRERMAWNPTNVEREGKVKESKKDSDDLDDMIDDILHGE